MSGGELLARLEAKEVLLGDGAWGTLLFERGLEAGQPPEIVNLLRPVVVEEIAGLYREAGADLITTNTFGGSPLRLAAHGLGERCAEINRVAVEAARRGAGEEALVSASVGPIGRLLRPYGEVEPEQAAAGFEEQIAALAAAGADLICVETMTDLKEAELAIRAAAAVAPSLPVIATMSFDDTPRGFFTVMGVSAEQAADGLAAAGADVIGSNCGGGIGAMVRLAAVLRRHTPLPLAIQSNAGLPRREGGRLVYPESPEWMAAGVEELLEIGVGIVGGCCGTGPDHVRAFRRAVDAWAAERKGVRS